MTLRNYLQIAGVMMLLAAGQLLFRKSALSVPSLGTLAGLLRLAATPSFLAALLIYGIATVMWVGVLQEVPLSRAYPFMALSFAVVPIAAILLGGETVTLRLGFGIALVLIGFLLIGSGG